MYVLPELEPSEEAEKERGAEEEEIYRTYRNI